MLDLLNSRDIPIKKNIVKHPFIKLLQQETPKVLS